MSHRRREQAAELLALIPPTDLMDLADLVLAQATQAGPESVAITRRPEVGSVVVLVREPVSGHRFQLTDLVVSTAEVELGGQPGWAMRPGAHPEAALAQAVCEAELARGGPLAPRIAQRCDAVETARRTARAAEWSRLAPTIVEFEEVL